MEKHSHTRRLSAASAISVLRLCLIPLLIYLCCIQKNRMYTMWVFGLSILLDQFDGFSLIPNQNAQEIGKVLDNVADKLTQTALFFALSGQYRLLLVPVALMVVNSLFVLVPMIANFPVKADDVHNRVCTVVINLLLILHLTWDGLDWQASTCSIIFSMIIVLHIYVIQYTRRMSRAQM